MENSSGDLSEILRREGRILISFCQECSVSFVKTDLENPKHICGEIEKFVSG